MTSDSASTFSETFEWPCRRSTKTIETSPIRAPRRNASWSVSMRNAYPLETSRSSGMRPSASRRQQRKAAGAVGDRPGPASDEMLRFTLVTGAWFVGLFGLMRLPWVERTLLDPFAQLQQGVADQLTGAPSDLVYADASCSGGDPMALCAGAILAFPAAWGARLRGGGAAAYGALPGGAVLCPAARRFLLLAALFVVAYFATAPFFYQSPAVDVIAGWIAMAGGTILSAAGTTARVQGALIFTPHGGFVVTQECIFTPLIPLYLAGALAAPLGWKRRAAVLLATPAVFFALGVSRLLVLAVPAAVVGSYVTAIHAFSQTLVAVLLVAAAAFWTAGGGRRGAARGCLAIGVGAVAAFAAAPVLGASVGGAAAGLQALAGHAGHAFADDQGAWAILPAFQVGLFTALWIAVARGGRSWRRALLGLGAVVVAQGALGLPVGELAHHYGFDPHVGLIRGWALVLPAAAVWWLGRPARIEIIDVSPIPPRALPLPG